MKQYDRWSWQKGIQNLECTRKWPTMLYHAAIRKGPDTFQMGLLLLATPCFAAPRLLLKTAWKLHSSWIRLPIAWSLNLKLSDTPIRSLSLLPIPLCSTNLLSPLKSWIKNLKDDDWSREILRKKAQQHCGNYETMKHCMWRQSRS